MNEIPLLENLTQQGVVEQIQNQAFEYLQIAHDEAVADQALPTPEELLRQVDAAITQTQALVEPLIDAIEKRQPGHYAGRSKLEHMEEMVEEAAKYSERLGLSPEESQILKAVFRLHDIGRHVEGFLNLNTLRGGVRHGALGAWLMAEYGVLDDLPKAVKYQILYAAYHHAERTMPEPKDAVEAAAHQACYLLRDVDKLEILLDEDTYQTKEGVLQQITAHYLPEDELGSSKASLSDERVRQQTLNLLEALKDYEPTEYPEALSDAEEFLYCAIIHTMTDPISINAWNSFTNHETVNTPDIKNSWASYTLFQLALLFDIHNEAVLDEVAANAEVTVWPRLQHIHHYDSERLQQVISTLATFLES